MSIFNYILVDNPSNISDSTILHEIQHLIERCDYEKYKFKVSIWKTIKFYVGYIFPQLLAIFSLLAVFNIWFLLFLVFLLPNPILSFYRRQVELRGYYWNWYCGDLIDFSRIFGGKSYYFMDLLHPNKYYYAEFKKLHDELYFSAENTENFYMFVLLKEFKMWLTK
jgi:hypothetical protein